MSKKKEKKGKKKKINPYKKFRNQIDASRGLEIPPQLILEEKEPGVFFGVDGELNSKCYIGMPQGADGNILVVGGNGSGKSAGIVKPTLTTWRGGICATDVKGELSAYYRNEYEHASQNGTEMRPYIIFDPTQVDGPSYDPFWWLLQDDESNLCTDVMEIALTIIPDLPNDNQPFWLEAERAVFAAGLYYFYQCGLSFSETLCEILNSGLSTFCEEIKNSGDIWTKMLLGPLEEMKAETIASIDRGLRNKLITLAADPYIGHAFRGEREKAKCFTWEDLDHSNIFLRIAADRMDQWGGAVNLMYAQLIRYLERRPEQHSEDGKNSVQLLLMMDEFPRFGRLEMIVDAISMLRSKKVNICLSIQSVAQLDRLYGEYGRQIILDNCQYMAILRANDADTQQILSQLIGTTKVLQESISRNLDESGKEIGYSKQRAEGREPRVFPHELSTLTDVVILSPYGPCRAIKRLSYGESPEQLQVQEKHNIMREEDQKMLTLKERLENATERVDHCQKAKRLADKNAREMQKKKDDHRKFIVGELVVDYFPELLRIDPGMPAENQILFRPFRLFLDELTANPALVQSLKEKALRKDSDMRASAGVSDAQVAQRVSGHGYLNSHGETCSEDGVV